MSVWEMLHLLCMAQRILHHWGDWEVVHGFEDDLRDQCLRYALRGGLSFHELDALGDFAFQFEGQGVRWYS